MGKTLVTSDEPDLGSIAVCAQALGNRKGIKLACYFSECRF
jgi:hypothetical protein